MSPVYLHKSLSPPTGNGFYYISPTLTIESHQIIMVILLLYYVTAPFYDLYNSLNPK
jgi:hypothetical protein